MNRRELLISIAAIPAVASADCRDENGMIGPGESSECLDLTIRRAVVSATSEKVTARALFGFGAYEDLFRKHKKKESYLFMFGEYAHRIRVTRLSVDVDRAIGCVVCEVQGQIWSSG